jgi:hypothetical protein
MFKVYICSFLFAQKRTKKGSQSLVPLSAEFPALLIKSRLLGKSYPFRDVYTPLRGTPPSRFTAFYFAARLREIAKRKS